MTKRNQFLVFFFYLVVVLFLFSPAIKAFFVSDDFDWVNRVKSLSPLTHNYFLSNADGARASGVYRPLTIISFWVNYLVADLNSEFFHLFSIILHALNAFLVFYLLKLILKPACPVGRSDVAAIIAGLFFAVLPNHPEAVAWISGRGDVLATFFYLLAIILYVAFRQKSGGWRLAVSLGCFLLALFSKEMAITLPAILIAYEVIWQIKQSRQIKQAILYLLPFVAVLAGYFVLRFFATGLFYGFYATSNLHFSLQRAWEMLGGGWLSNFLNSAQALAYWPVLPLAVISLCILIGALLRAETRKAYIFGAVFFILTLAPVFYLQLNHLTGEGERFIYLPSVGFSILAAVLIGDLLGRKSKILLPISAALVISIYFSWMLWNKNTNWQRAGELSRSLLFNFGQIVDLTKPNQGVVILGLPDNFRGAQIFRNGWLAALDLYYPFYAPDLLTVKAGLNIITDSDAAAINWQTTADGFTPTPSRTLCGSAVGVEDNSRPSSQRSVPCEKVWGFIGESAQPIFYGTKNLDSLDYQMEIKNYQKDILSGPAIEFAFTPQFKKQNENKAMVFLVMRGGRFEKLRSF